MRRRACCATLRLPDVYKRQAYDLICTMVNEVKETYGPEAIMVFGGTGRIASTYYPMIALNVFGTPNACYAQSGMACYLSLIHI